MNVPYRLAVIDLDETLLGPEKKVSPENLSALSDLRAAGLEVVIASGRHHGNIVQVAAHYQIKGWIISSQGAQVQHSETGEIIYNRTVPSDLGLELLRRGRNEGVSLLVYHQTGVFIEKETEWTGLYTSRAGHTPRMGDLEVLVRDGVTKVLWSREAERVDQLEPLLSAEFDGRLYVVETEHEILEFCSIEANKALGAQAVAQKRGVGREEVVAFGDGNNDVPLLQWAGQSVAMDHGRESAKAAARLQTPPGDPRSAFARGVALILGS